MRVAGLCLLVLVLVAECSAEAAATRAARGFFEQRLGVEGSTVIGVNAGDGRECAVVTLRAPDGRRRGVAVARGGDPARWQALGMSRKLQLRDYSGSGDDDCGLYDARELRRQPAPEEPVRLGATYRFVIETPCKVPYLLVDGSLWAVARPWGSTAPAGERVDGRYGRLTVITPARAVFRDMHGHILRFARQAPDGPPPCA